MGDLYVHYDPSGWLWLVPTLPDLALRWSTVHVDGLDGPVLAPEFNGPLDPSRSLRGEKCC
jgi:hypothetical protein